MGDLKKFIEVYETDDNKLMNQCVALFLIAHPEMKGVLITRKKMFQEVVRFYMEA